MRYILLRMKRFCGFITGFVFFLSGIFKLIDPVGAALVMDEYFNFLHIGFLAPTAKVTAWLLAFTETLIGTALITGVWRKMTALTAMVFQGFFTLLTLLLVIFNPPMDCGCFGEVIHLTHTQTFVKNIVLVLLLGIYYFPAKHLGRNKPQKYVSFGIVATSVFCLGIYSWLYIPLIDFTDYRPAAALSAGSAFAVPQEDMYESVFIYEKDGVRQEFTLGHLPDSTWSFVSTETVLKEGYEQNEINLSFYDYTGSYADSLAARGKVMVISVYDTQFKAAKWERIARFIEDAETAGFTPLLLVATTPEMFGDILSELPEQTGSIIGNAAMYSDYKTLITMNRSNGGVTYFSDGYLIRKWAGRQLPTLGELKETAAGDDTEVIIDHDTHSSLTFQGFLLYVCAVMLLL